MSSLTEQEQEASQRDANIDVSEVATTASDATDEARESRDVTLEPFKSNLSQNSSNIVIAKFVAQTTSVKILFDA